MNCTTSQNQRHPDTTDSHCPTATSVPLAPEKSTILTQYDPDIEKQRETEDSGNLLSPAPKSNLKEYGT